MAVWGIFEQHGFKLVLLAIFLAYVWSFLKPKLDELKKKSAPVVRAGTWTLLCFTGTIDPRQTPRL
jgi:hypothetical protein